MFIRGVLDCGCIIGRISYVTCEYHKTHDWSAEILRKIMASILENGMNEMFGKEKKGE